MHIWRLLVYCYYKQRWHKQLPSAREFLGYKPGRKVMWPSGAHVFQLSWRLQTSPVHKQSADCPFPPALSSHAQSLSHWTTFWKIFLLKFFFLETGSLICLGWPDFQAAGMAGMLPPLGIILHIFITHFYYTFYYRCACDLLHEIRCEIFCQQHYVGTAEFQILKHSVLWCLIGDIQMALHSSEGLSHAPWCG